MISLRPYQSELIDRLRDGYRKGLKSQLLVSPTASGKTVLFSFITRGACERGLRTVIVAHRQEILDQISRMLTQVGVDHGMICQGAPIESQKQVQVASINTLIRRFDQIPKQDFLVIDECHRSAAQSYINLFAWHTGQTLGVTATPERLDGKGLSDFFQTLVRGPEVQWLIDNQFLARPVYYAPSTLKTDGIHTVAGDFNKSEIAEAADKPAITGCAIEHYQRICSGATAVVFCVTIEHAKHVADKFNAAGIPAETIDGTLTGEQRRSMVDRFSSGRTKILTSCELISEGFDLPAVGAAILLRATKSLALHLQQVGRSLRIAPGKTKAIILDHVGNCLRLGTAEEQRDWSLQGNAGKKPVNPDRVLARCDKCFRLFAGAQCPECRTVRETAHREIEQVDGQLTEIDLAAIRAKRREEGQCKTYDDLRELGKKRGYKPGWAYMRWKARNKQHA